MADVSSSHIKKLFLKLKSFLSTKDVLSFIGFLLISASFWFVNALNKERELSVEIPIKYVDLPRDISFNEELPKSINVRVSDLGSNLWRFMKTSVKPIVIKYSSDNSSTSGVFNISNSQLKSKISENILSTSSIMMINPDEINLTYVKLYKKRVPVKLIGNIQVDDQYMLSNPIEFAPVEIDIFGPRDIIEKIVEVKTQKIEVTKLNDTLSIILPLEEIISVQYSVDNILVTAKAEMFTEKSVTLPVQVVNKPSNIDVLLFPTEVKVVFNIGVKWYKLFQFSDIQVVADFSDIQNGNLKKKKLKVVNNKPYISNIRISPQEIDFLLQEK